MRHTLPVLALLLSACTAAAPGSDPLAGLSERGGFLDLWVDEGDGRVLARLPEPGEDGVALEAIHTARLTSGLGSNPVGLDRGWGQAGQVVRFVRRGDRVVLEQPNLAYRVDTDNPMEARAVRESFASSFLASFPIESEAGGLTIDLTDFLESDLLNLSQYLKDAGQGSFAVADDLTLVDTENTFSFPDNSEVDVFFTLASADPGREVATTAANGRNATLVVHHSFVRLPDTDGFTPRRSDPRAGAVELTYYDYSAPLSAPIETRLAVHHRIRRDEDGNVVPIVYYIDGGAPEPVRGALVDGARWWADAFAAAGYPDAYRVEVLPEDVHPLDVRYNVVQWVHRQTRGWSYGGGVVDPRTGERLKGHVNLGSLRVRQDRMIFEGLLGADKTDTGAPDDPVQLALARIRQLSAHEIGHSLGFAHNFAASTDGKASVMDYPAPDVRVVDGALDASQAYGVGIGAWDKIAAQWLYGDCDAAERDALLEDAFASGLTFVADTHGRGAGESHPEASVWDNGSDPVATLDEVMEVRRIALSRFGAGNLPDGAQQSDLNAAIVPTYLYHRFQTAAAAKLIGGMSFTYGPAGERTRAEIVVPERQREAIDAVLATLEPGALDLPDDVLSRLTPRTASYSFADSDRELFRPTAGPAFDVTAAADTAANLTLDVLFHPKRLARMVEFHRRDPRQPSVAELIRDTASAVYPVGGNARLKPIADTVRARFVAKMAEVLRGEGGVAVKAAAKDVLVTMRDSLRRRDADGDRFLSDEIDRALDLDTPYDTALPEPQTLPPGSPIGSE